jgi:hypothetical protein
MKAFLIDPFTKTITAVEYDGNYKSIYKMLGCDLFDVVELPDFEDAIYVDDEGLMVAACDQAYFMVRELPRPLAGKGLVLGTNDDGESADPLVTIEQLTARVRWVSREEALRASEAGIFDTSISDGDGIVIGQFPVRIEPGEEDESGKAVP